MPTIAHVQQPNRGLSGYLPGGGVTNAMTIVYRVHQAYGSDAVMVAEGERDYLYGFIGGARLLLLLWLLL